MKIQGLKNQTYKIFHKFHFGKIRNIFNYRNIQHSRVAFFSLSVFIILIIFSIGLLLGFYIKSNKRIPNTDNAIILSTKGNLANIANPSDFSDSLQDNTTQSTISPSSSTSPIQTPTAITTTITILPTQKPADTPKPTAIPQQNTPIPTIAPTSAPIATPTPIVFHTCSASFNSQMLTLINDYRVQNGKNTLALETKMNNAACNHSVWMNENNILSHTGENGSSPWDRCAAASTWCDGENLAMNQNPTATNFLNQWINSAGHNANMLGDHTSIGIGLDGFYVTTVFR
jgi:uncharacterized protein YkwD